MTGTSSGLKRNNAAVGPGRLTAAPSPLDPIEYGNDAGLAERRLWLSALALLLHDGQRYWQDMKNGRYSTDDDLEQAFDSLVQCTWMLRRICTYTGHDAEWISKGFNQWCESN